MAAAAGEAEPSHSGRIEVYCEAVNGGTAPEPLQGLGTESGAGVQGAGEALTVDEALQRHVGEFGLAQLWHFVLVTMSWTLVGLQTFTMMFSERVPEWHCVNNPKIVSMENSINGTTHPFSIEAVSRVLNHDDAQRNAAQFYVSCSPTASLCDMERSTWEWDGGRSVSVVTEWDLICGESYKAGLVGSVFFTGFLFGAGVVGTLSDGCLGRKGALGGSLLIALIFGLLTSISPNYWVYLFCRGVSGFGLSGTSVTQYVLATELVGPTKRGQVGLATAYTYALGQMVLAIVAYFIRTWRKLFLFTTLPSLVYLCVIFPFVEESPRWYLVHGKPEKALQVLRNIARTNGRNLPNSLRLRTEQEREDSQSERVVVSERGRQNGTEDSMRKLLGEDLTVPSTSGSVLNVFRYTETRNRMFIMMFCWFTCAVVYYGLSLNSVNLGENAYFSTFMNAFIEFPAYCILAFVIERIGRRPLIMGGLILSGICCFLGVLFLDAKKTPTTLFVSSAEAHVFTTFRSRNNYGVGNVQSAWEAPETSDRLYGGTMRGTLTIVCALLGKFGISSSYALAYLYAGELFPTVVRNTALSIASQASQIGTILAPWVLVLKGFHYSLPLLVMGFFGIVAGGCMWPLPETLNQPLLETMEGLLGRE